MKALFAGSFDPFTIGHKDIIDRSLPLFDRIIIGIGYNVSKHYIYSSEEIAANIGRIFASEPKIEVKIYNGLTVDFARQESVDCFLRSVRSVRDFEYERDLAEINRRLSGIETFFMFSSPELSHISSSMVRELIGYGKDVSAFLP